MSKKYSKLFKKQSRKFRVAILSVLVRTSFGKRFEGELCRLKERLRNTVNEYHEWVRLYDTITDADKTRIVDLIQSFTYTPTISIIMPVYKPDLIYFDKAIASIKNQLYTNWELCIADDASCDARLTRIIAHYAAHDSRIKVVHRSTNGHISASSNSALTLASGEYVAFMDHDDILPAHGLYMVVQCINDNHNAVDIIYSDEDKIDGKDVRHSPYFKGDWNSYFILSQNYVAHLGIYRKSLVDAIGGFRTGYEGSQDYDLLLRILCLPGEISIKHIPFILYHWRRYDGSTTFSSQNQCISDRSAHRALTDYVSSKGISMTIKTSRNNTGCWNQTFGINDPRPYVSVIIPTRDNITFLDRCIRGLKERTWYSDFEILIIDNNSADGSTYAYYDNLIHMNATHRLHILYDKNAFNFSRLNNTAAAHASGDVIIFMNDDVVARSSYWMYNMVSIAIHPDVGAVGAKLLYDNDTIQHAGVVLGIYGVASHPFRFVDDDSNAHYGYPNLMREVSAVTAACMAVEKSKFVDVGGFDEQLFPINYNDVDLSLKLSARGYKNIYAPSATLYHSESMSRGRDDTPEKLESHEKASYRMIAKYGKLLRNDPFYNPNLSLKTEGYDLSFPPRVLKPWRNWVELVVPFHRGDVLIAIQVASCAAQQGMKVRMHIARSLMAMAASFDPPFPIEPLPIDVPPADKISTSLARALHYVEDKADFSGVIASIHDQDFRNNGLNLAEHLLRELDLPIDLPVPNRKPSIKQIYENNIDKNTILIHGQAGWNLKSLPASLVAGIKSVVKEYGLQLIQVGGPTDILYPVCDWYMTGDYAMSEWAYLFTKARGIICCDSWMAHFAAIMDVNHMVLYGATNPKYVNCRSNFVDKTSVYHSNNPFCPDSPCNCYICKKHNALSCKGFDYIEISAIQKFMEEVLGDYEHPMVVN
ncbi:MAG: glycosyltransferase [Syntrophobacteraceae bacterium]